MYNNSLINGIDETMVLNASQQEISQVVKYKGFLQMTFANILFSPSCSGKSYFVFHQNTQTLIINGIKHMQIFTYVVARYCVKSFWKTSSLVVTFIVKSAHDAVVAHWEYANCRKLHSFCKKRFLRNEMTRLLVHQILSVKLWTTVTCLF